jgi:hypothetical protein
MLRFNVHAPRRFYADKKDLFVITGKQHSYFGVHRTLVRPDNDMVCTKTCILSFTTPYHANVLSGYLQNAQEKRISVIHRDLSNNSMALEMPLERKVVLSVSSCPKLYLEYICLLHHFDMYLVYNVRKQQPTNTLDVDCMEYRTGDYPDTWMLKKMLESLIS